MANSPAIVAEVGGTCERNERLMHRSCSEARSVGATHIKFQWCSNRRALADQRRMVWADGLYTFLDFPLDYLQTSSMVCHKQHVQFGCTVYIKEDVKALLPIVDFLKVASFEAGNAELRQTILAEQKKLPTPKPIFVSLGGRPNVHAIALAWYKESIQANVAPPVLLYCVSAYPTPNQHMQLGTGLANRYAVSQDVPFGLQGKHIVHGLSDHTLSTMTGAVAVSMRGDLKVIEKHFCLSVTPASNPDFGVSVRSRQLLEYVGSIRTAIQLIGDRQERHVVPGELMCHD